MEKNNNNKRRRRFQQILLQQVKNKRIKLLPRVNKNPKTIWKNVKKKRLREMNSIRKKNSQKP